RTGIHFEGKDILVLEKTSFKYAEGNVDFAARLDIGKEGTTPFEFELHTENINLQKLLPSVNYFGIKLLQNLDVDYENIDIDILLKGVVDDVKGLIPNTAIGELTFENKFVKGKVNFHPEAKMEGEPVIRTKLNLEGNPHVFNDFFKTEDFFFENGVFRVQFDYEGEVINFEDLLNKASASFSLEKSEVYYKAADVRFPLTHVYLDLRENKGNFRFFMRSDSLREELQFMGNINNISELILGNTGKPFHTTAAIYSPKLTWKNFKGFFASSPTSLDTANIQKTEKKGMSINAGMKRAVKGILNTFNPKLRIQIDNFEYSDKLAVRDLKAGVGLVNSSILEVYNTGFKFHDGSVNLRGQLNLEDSEDTSFSANFDTKDLDVAALLESLDYLSIKALEETENLKGRITMNLDLEGVIGGEQQSLILEKTKGVLDFELNNVEIKGLKIIDKIAEKVKKRKRFKEVIFAPISNRITINGTSLDIPLMEIESNALNLFIEGRVSPPDSTNIWISIPVKNLRKPKKDAFIVRQGYNSTKNKVFLEVKPNEEGKHKMYFRFKKKKFYEERGIPEQYKKDKRENRKIYKKLKKEKKRLKSGSD
ncbi:MAG: AsmA-like C-terminal region-containing protein, partial [Chitinophagales bacterium]